MATRKPTEPTVGFKEIVDALPAALAVGAAAAYGALIVTYSEFYSELGVRSREVGLEYGPGLGGLAGVAILLFLLVALAACLLLLYVTAAARLRPKLAPQIARARVWLLLVTGALVFGFLVVAFADRANDAADRAKAGEPVEPFRIFGVEVLGFRADLAEIEVADPKGLGTSTWTQLRAAETLLYLGRSDSTVVVYEQDRQSAWHLPASVFAVRALNCETKREERDPKCPD